MSYLAIIFREKNLIIDFYIFLVDIAKYAIEIAVFIVIEWISNSVGEDFLVGERLEGLWRKSKITIRWNE